MAKPFNFDELIKSGVNQAMEECELTIGMTLKQAVEKQIPKKVTHEATLAKCLTCPHCKNVVDKFTTFAGAKVRVTYDYCHFCGQHLDWSDENA